jgi:hypothetical protein
MVATRVVSLSLFSLTTMLTACSSTPTPNQSADRSFADDVAFLRKHRDTIVLSAPAGSGKIAVVPGFQARVMTSTARGDAGQSFGFLKDDLIASTGVLPHINPYGGEDRFWLGPEGGQFSIFFAPGVPEQTLKHWQTPAAIDTEAFTLTQKSDHSASFIHNARFTNASGTNFDVKIDRSIAVLDPADALRTLGIAPSGLDVVAFESRNTITNAGTAAWTEQTGLLSVWILGMFKPSPATTVVVPINATQGQDLSKLVNDSYFGKVPADRLKAVPRGNPAVGAARPLALLFKGDGQQRTKIGVAPAAALPIAGSYDPSRNVLTLVTFTIPTGTHKFVNSMWETKQADPFAGDVVNSYNDGPSEPGGKPFGPFYEIESSSPAASLVPGKSLTHTHRTIHLEGPREALDKACRAALGLGLDELKLP